MARPRQFEQEQVMDAVMDTFWRRGYEATTAQDLVKATGLGRGSLYNAFSSKQALYEQALRHYQQRSRHNVEQLQQAGPVRERLRALLLSVLDADLGAAQQRGCLATNAAVDQAGHNPEVKALVRENFGILEKGLRQAIVRGQQAGELRPGTDADALAAFVLNAMQGLRVLAKTTPAQERERLVAVIELTLGVL